MRETPRTYRTGPHCKLVNSCFISKHFERLVGAGLALPLFYATDRPQGQGKPSPYETLGCGSAALRYTGYTRSMGSITLFLGIRGLVSQEGAQISLSELLPGLHTPDTCVPIQVGSRPDSRRAEILSI